jgi:Zn-dependent protease
MLRRSTSIKLMDAFGIRIGVDGSWFLILFVLIFVLSGPFRNALHSSDAVAYLTTVVSVLLLFASLIVHELGHALVARRQGIEVRRIDLYLFGGLTQMGRDANTPGEEFKVAAAGPAATLAVILVCLGLDLLILGPHRLSNAVTLDSQVRITPVLLSLSWLLPMNVLLLAFNLVPAFPLDGGRIARAIVWRVTGDRTRGTRASARLGQAFAVVLVGVGIWLLLGGSGSLSGLWLVALAWMIGQSARGAIVQTQLTQRIEGVRVSDIMDRHPVAIPTETPVSQALDEYFLRYGWSWFPIIDGDGRYVGIARQEELQGTQDGGEGWLTVGGATEVGDTGSWRVQEDRPLTEVLGSESLGSLGALMAVDTEGVLRGVVTVEQVRRVLQSAFSAPAA